MDRTELLYVADPMCSWCWGFAPVLAAAEARLPAGVSVRLVLGGLAPDSDEPMNERTRAYVQAAWDQVEARTGATFNREFWSACRPRRSTWPACRAVLAAGERGREMFAAIQRAYYLEARNPSDRDTLIALAAELGLDREGFSRELDAPETQRALEADFALRDALGVSGYPTLVLRRGAERQTLVRGHAPLEDLVAALAAVGVELARPGA